MKKPQAHDLESAVSTQPDMELRLDGPNSDSEDRRRAGVLGLRIALHGRRVIDRIRTLWRGLPQKTRVQLIASVLLVFAGTEVLVLAPYIMDIAVMIDLGGLVVIVAALRSSVIVSIMQLRAFATVILKPLWSVLRAGQLMGDFEAAFSPSWYRYYFLFDRIATRCGVVLIFGSVGLVLTRAAIEKL